MTRITKTNFKKALVNSGGNQSTIAKAIGVTRGAVTLFLQRPKNADMKDLLEIEAERIIDVSENVVDHDIVKNRNIDTAKWKLINSKRGKARGYGPKQEIEQVGDIPITINLITKSNEEIKKLKDLKG